MEATGRDGGVGARSWSHRRRHEETESSCYTISSSSRSGTIVSSTAYTSGASRLSSGIYMEAALDQLDLELELRLGTPEPDKMDAEFAQPIKKPRKLTEETLKEMDLELELSLGTTEPDEKDGEFGQAIKKHHKKIEETPLKETRMEHIEGLVQEFFRGPSEDRSILGGGGSGSGGVSALERWFSELGVSWVPQLDVGASSFMGLRPQVMETIHLTSSAGIWIQALTQIMETIHLTESLFPDHGHGFVGMSGISEEEIDSGKQAATSLDPAIQFALFFQEAMAKMLVFVDVMFSKSICIHVPQNNSSSFLNSCFCIHSALSKASSRIRLQFHLSPSAEVEKIEKEMISLLSAKRGKAFDAIWNFMEERTRVLKSMEDSLGAETLQGSLGIHQATCSVVNHIKFLLYNCWEVDPLFVSQAASLGKYVPQTGFEEAQPFISMIAEKVSCLQEKLITKSQSFLDKGLGLLFLLNNTNFIGQQLQFSLSCTIHLQGSLRVNWQCIRNDLAPVISFITRKVEHYTESYIQVSWEPMLACLFNPTPLRLVRKYSPLSKFESEFQKTYSTQIQSKVSDPKLKIRLRKAIIEKIIPGYTKYIDDSNVSNPKFTPQELKEKLQELFEG